MKIKKWFKRKTTLTRAKLRTWLLLEDINEQIRKAVETSNVDQIVDLLVCYVSTAYNSSEKYLNVPWVEFVSIFGDAQSINRPSIDFPILNSSEKLQKNPWDYDERTWYMWLHLFSSNYGWTEDIVANLDVDVALGMFQEILVDEQLQKEQAWVRSEVAYGYNSQTKKSEFRELPRPLWMKVDSKPREIPKTKIRKDMIPTGIIMSWSADDVIN